MKRTVEVARTIPVAADAAWAIVRTGTDVNQWFPVITACRREGDQQFCTMANGGELVESITGATEATRTFSYIVTGHPLPVGAVSSSLQVRSAGEGEAEIVWRAEFDGEDPAATEVAAMLEGLYGQGIEGLADFVRKAA